METKVSVSVITYPDDKEPIARVRKVVLDETVAQHIQRFALSQTGEWIKVALGEMWPDNAKLEVMIHEGIPGEDENSKSYKHLPTLESYKRGYE